MIRGSAGADPGPATHVDSVSATVGSSAIQVGGTAAFVDVPVVIGQDPTLDALPPVPGTDVTTLTIARPDPGGDSLLFTMGIDLQPPSPISGPPFAVYYMWDLSVTKPDGTTGDRKVLSANRLPGSNLPSTNPRFRVWTWSGGSCGCYPAGPFVNGTMANGVIEWPVKLTTIKASAGDTIAQQGGMVGSFPGAGYPVDESNIWFNELPFDLAMYNQYTIPGASVQLGIARAGTPAD